MLDVIAIGELLIDFASVDVNEEGYPTLVAQPGGAPANFLAALAKFGRKTSLIAKVGDDAFGHLLEKTMNEIGVDTSNLIVDPSVFTTLAFVTLDRNGDRSFSFARKPGADTQIQFHEIDPTLVEKCQVVHFGTLSLTDEPARSTTIQLIEMAKKQNKLISFDPNLRKPLWNDLKDAKRQMIWGLTKSDVVKISDEEVEFLFGLDPESGAQYLLDNYPIQLVYVTCGEKGCYYKNHNAQGWVQSLNNIHVVDTTGAGDIFGGSAMHKLLEMNARPSQLTKVQLDEIVNFACTSAALSTTQFGGLKSVPAMNQIESIIKCK